MPSFGQLISDTRKGLALSQRELAARLFKEDGAPISPQYLNDLEHDRRNAPGDHLIGQLASVLGISADLLYNCAGEMPPDLRCLDPKSANVEGAYAAFRQKLSE